MITTTWIVTDSGYTAFKCSSSDRLDVNRQYLRDWSQATKPCGGRIFFSYFKSANGIVIPGGAGISGRILIQIVDVNGVARDVTRQILSMGMTEGEPNAIVMLQRPLWAAFTQGNRDASNSQNTAPDGTKYFDCLTDIMDKTYMMTDGEITRPFFSEGWTLVVWNSR